MKYTLTRGLTELKVLKARYEKELKNLNIVAVKHGTKLRNPNGFYTPEDFANRAKAAVQSVEALERRIIEIKTKIDAANSVTMVQIGSKNITIQQALVEKSLIGLKEQRLRIYKHQLSQARMDYENALAENRNRVVKLVSDSISSDKTSKESSSAVEAEANKSVEALYKVELVDSSSLSDRIEILEKEIDDFKSNVDFALSEINATTFIELED